MLRLIILLPFLILLVVFVLLNQTGSAMELPYYSWQSSTGVIALITAVLFFLLGALMLWFAELRQRRRARRAEQQVRGLEAQIAELRVQLAQSVAHNVAHAGVPAATRSSWVSSSPSGGASTRCAGWPRDTACSWTSSCTTSPTPWPPPCVPWPWRGCGGRC